MLLKIPTDTGWVLLSDVSYVDHGETDFHERVTISLDPLTTADSFGWLMHLADGYGPDIVVDGESSRSLVGLHNRHNFWMENGFKWVFFTVKDSERVMFFDRDATAYLMNDAGQTIHQL